MSFVLGQLLGGTKRHSRWQDGDLRHRIGVRRERRHQRMPGLMDGHRLFFLGQQHIGGIAPAQDDPVPGRVEVIGRQHAAPLPHGVDRGLVDEVGEIGAGEPGSRPRDHGQVHLRAEAFALAVHLQDLRPFPLGGQRHGDLPIEPSGTQQRRVEGLGPVGRGEDNHALGRVEPVHLGQQLVERLLTLVVTTADETGPPLAPDSVDLIDEDDGRGAFACLVEQVADAGGADPHEHFDEPGAAHRQERHLGLTGDRSGEQRLAGTGRPDHEHPTGALRPGLSVSLGMPQEVDDFADLLFRALVAGHVGEPGCRALGINDLCPGPADAAEPARQRPLRRSAGPDEEGHQQEQRQEAQQDRQEGCAGVGRLDIDLLGLQLAEDALGVESGRDL